MTLKRLLIVGVVGIVGVLTFEELRHLYNSKKRKKELKKNVSETLIVNGRFVNPFEEFGDKNIANLPTLIYWWFTRRTSRKPTEEEIRTNLPLHKPNLRPSLSESWIQQMTVTWIGIASVFNLGQSTCFVQMDGYNILTDPIFSSRTTGEWFGPKRLVPIPCKMEDLPVPDVILVSHNHYDHLDLNAVEYFKSSSTWYVPLGMKDWLKSHGVEKCVELDWWQEYDHDQNLKIIGTPIQHWSGRHFFDVNSSLWSSFVVRSKSNSFFHCGDTGYCSVFKEIGKRYGPIDFAALPIGSYEPRYFMCHQHMNPQEAVQVHIDLQARQSLGVHWGTFLMSDEDYMDPKKEFEKARIESKLDEDACFTSHIGETVVLKN